MSRVESVGTSVLGVAFRGRRLTALNGCSGGQLKPSIGHARRPETARGNGALRRELRATAIDRPKKEVLQARSKGITDPRPRSGLMRF